MKILMVCLGNICRSPLAHGIFLDMVQKEGLEWTVDSAGTGDWHVGHPPDARAIAIAKSYGLDISTQKAQQFEPFFFDAYDRILVMDHQNFENVIALARTEDDRKKVTLFLENDIVPDPYFDDKLFDPVYHMLRQRSEELLENFKKSIFPS